MEVRQSDKFLLKRLNHKAARLLQEIDKFNIAEYLELLNNARFLGEF